MTTFTADGTLPRAADRDGTGWFRRFLRAVVIARAERSLKSLDDLSLARLGIGRSEIPAIARRIHDGFRTVQE